MDQGGKCMKPNFFKKINLIFLCIFVLGISAYSANQKKQNNTMKTTKQIKVTFVELGSKNCIPCKMMERVMADVEKEYGDQVKVVFHDVWTKEGEPYGEKYGIRAIPTQIFLDKNGKEYFRHEGFFPKEELVKVLRQKGVNNN
jgi:thioredoxin 1